MEATITGETITIPFFIAETPRAGAFGHCFIVPPGHVPTSTHIAEFCRVAAQHNMGTNFVATSRQVVQRLPTGSVRQGTEILLLAGINYPKLTEAQLQQLSSVLKIRLDDLERLIENIAWARECQSLKVIRQEFADWVREDQLADLPLVRRCDKPLLAKPRIKPQPLPAQPRPISDGKEGGRRFWRRCFKMSSLIGTVLLAGVIAVSVPKVFQRLFPQQQENWQSPCSDLATLACFSQSLQALAVACHQPYEKFLTALYRAMVPHGTSDTDVDHMRQKLFNMRDSSIWDLVVHQYYRHGKIQQPYKLIDDNARVVSTLQDILSNTSQNIEDILVVRRRIAAFGNIFATFHTDLVRWGTDKLPDDGPFAKLIRDVASRQCAACGNVEPIFPFLVKADQEIVNLFYDIFLLEGVPLREALPAENYAQLYSSERSLQVVLAAIAASNEQIRSAIHAEKNRAKQASSNSPPPQRAQ